MEKPLTALEDLQKWLEDDAPDPEEAGLILAKMTVELRPMKERIKLANYILGF